MRRLFPLLDKWMMRSVVTLTAAAREARVHDHGCERNVRRSRIRDVRESGAVTALALHIVIALITRGVPACLAGCRVALRAYRVAALAAGRRVTTARQRL